ncbi:hypothetical protein [Streptomyces sp. NPDC057552]|uniref:hypothetical protein n=1 Tax=Streptomyces sp. NPDC057552 TaxID=3350537 RepID=UPI0036AC3FAF
MTDTTTIGYWTQYQTRGDDSLDTAVDATLGDSADNYDLGGLAVAWHQAINAALPDGVSLINGREFYGPADPQERSWAGDLDIAAVIESVDLWALAPDYELWSRDRIAQEIGIQPRSVRSWIARHKVQRADWDDASGRPMAQYRAGDIKTAQAAAHGQGARTDL